MAVVGQNATLLHEIPLFTSQEPVNNILLYKVNDLHSTTHTYTDIHVFIYRAWKHQFWCSVVPIVSRAGLWWAALCLWLVSMLKAAVCIPAVRCVPEPEDWAVCGGMMPARTQRQSEYYVSIIEKLKPTKSGRQRQEMICVYVFDKLIIILSH